MDDFYQHYILCMLNDKSDIKDIINGLIKTFINTCTEAEIKKIHDTKNYKNNLKKTFYLFLSCFWLDGQNSVIFFINNKDKCLQDLTVNATVVGSIPILRNELFSFPLSGNKRITTYMENGWVRLFQLCCMRDTA